LRYETAVDGTFTTYYVNDLTRSQAQDGITNTYELDSTRRQRMRTRVKGEEESTEIYHYANGSDSPAWVDKGEGEWTRFIAGLGAMAIEDSATEEVTLQLSDLHGDVVATADIDPEATELLSAQQFDEYGNPKSETTPKLGWLGSKLRRTELPSGVIQMGVRSYVPAMGRFLSRDPVKGGSANAYEYAAGDPVNNLDLTGEKCVGSKAWVRRCKLRKDAAWARRSNKRRRVAIRFRTKAAAMKFAARLNSNAIKRMRNKIGKLKREDMTQLRVKVRKAKLANEMLPIEPFDCDDLSVVGVLAGVGLTLARAPMGFALVIGGAAAGPTIGSKAGAC